MSDTRRYLSTPAATLAADLSTSGTNIILASALGWDGSALTTAMVNTDYVPITLINDAKTKVEFMLVTNASIANATTTGLVVYKRGLKLYAEGDTTDIDEVTANKLAWTAGETKVLLGSNQPWMLAQFASRGNDETIIGQYTFANTARPQLDTDAATTTDEEFVTYGQLVATAIAGATDADSTHKGIVEEATPAEQAAGTATGSTSARLYVASANAKATSAGAADANKAVVTDANGVIDQTFLDSARTWGAVQSFTADNAQITTDPDSANDAVRKSYADNILFGDGSDGDLDVTSGTTTLSTDKIYQYKSLNIDVATILTVGGAAANKPLRIRVQGDCTIAGTINLKGQGATGGAGGTTSTGGTVGTAGSVAIGFLGYGYGGGGGEGDYTSTPASGNDGASASATAPGAGGTGEANCFDGAAGGAGTQIGSGSALLSSVFKFGALLAGSGSGGGGGGSGRTNGQVGAAGGAGGNGGGCLILEVGGNLIISGTVDVSGNNGSDGGTNGYGASGGGGGGGGGGTFLCIYRGTLTDTGTYTVAGGTGGLGDTTGTETAGNGGNGSAGSYALTAI